MQAISTIPGIGPLLPWIMAAISIASALAPFIPPSWPIYRVVNALAVNVGQARNFSDPKA
jgi:hypothetical protein